MPSGYTISMERESAIKGTRTMKFTKPVLALSAVAFSVFALITPIESASARTVSSNPFLQTSEAGPAAQKLQRVARNRRYDRRRHGRRYRGRRGRNRHYYNGYWYAVPFWLGAAAAAGAYDDGDDDYRDDSYRGGGRCEQKADACAANWGRSGPDFDGCMRYEGCD
jgi:hypothetical protein